MDTAELWAPGIYRFEAKTFYGTYMGSATGVEEKIDDCPAEWHLRTGVQFVKAGVTGAEKPQSIYILCISVRRNLSRNIHTDSGDASERTDADFFVIAVFPDAVK